MIKYKKDKGVMNLGGKAIRSTEKLEASIQRDGGTILRTGHGVRTIGLSFTKSLTHKGYVELKGRKVEDTKDLAIMSQIKTMWEKPSVTANEVKNTTLTINVRTGYGLASSNNNIKIKLIKVV